MSDQKWAAPFPEVPPDPVDKWFRQEWDRKMRASIERMVLAVGPALAGASAIGHVVPITQDTLNEIEAFVRRKLLDASGLA